VKGGRLLSAQYVNAPAVKVKGRSVLNKAGLRATNQRALLLAIIRQGDEHMDAFELYRRAQEKEPRISLSTVYRTLQKFKELGLVEEVHLGEGHHHYEIKHGSEHHHLVCLGCGRVVEFVCPMSCNLKENIANSTGFEITESTVRMTGYCPECRKANKESS
jgi:Fe2+ or Zn2+ uptake regulation protein